MILLRMRDDQWVVELWIDEILKVSRSFVDKTDAMVFVKHLECGV